MFWAVTVAVACVWFLTLDVRHLLPTDEGRYAEIAREMWASGDWVTIRYNGLKYFEKPPFHLWATALAYSAFGIGEWQARLWGALSGAGGLLVTTLAARRWFGDRVALLAALVLLAAPAWNIASHFNSLDIGVSGALACVLAGVLLAQHPQASTAQRRSWMWFAWLAMAVAVLTKGLIGIVLPALVLVVYSLVGRDWQIWRRLHLASGGLLMLAVTAPWFVLVTLRNPEFPRFFFIHEHWQRYTSSVHDRAGPWWYFVPQLLLGFLPWLGLLPGIARTVRREVSGDGFRPALLLGVWAVAIFVFFSASSSKLPGYIIPIYPALAILAAKTLGELTPAAWNRQVIFALVVMALGLASTPLIAHLGQDDAASASFRSFAPWIAGGCTVAIAGLAGAWVLNRSDTLRSVAAFSLAVFAMTTIGLLGHESFGRSTSGVDLVAPIRAVLRPGMPIYSVRLLDHTLPFYLRRTTVMVESPNELAFGTEQEPGKWLPTLDAFLREWSSGPEALAIMSPETFARLREKDVLMIPVAADARRVVVANFKGPAS